MSAALLPTGFESLEPYADRWNVTSSDERRAVRLAMSMAELRAFYDAALPLAPAAFKRIDDEGLASPSPPAQRLFRVMLGLAHSAVSIETHQAVRGHFAPAADSVRVVVDLHYQ